jgi:hypothetical protein
LIVNRRCRTRQIVNLVDLYVERKGNVVTHQFKMRVSQQVDDVLLRSGKEVVYAKNVIALREQALAQVRTQKTAPPVTRTRFLPPRYLIYSSQIVEIPARQLCN